MKSFICFDATKWCDEKGAAWQLSKPTDPQERNDHPNCGRRDRANVASEAIRVWIGNA
jgi:hypothetical protein